ncbi:MAG: hypothetical protein ACYSUX_01095, partial [Planctomycetota bacterium]
RFSVAEMPLNFMRTKAIIRPDHTAITISNRKQPFFSQQFENKYLITFQIKLTGQWRYLIIIPGI